LLDGNTISAPGKQSATLEFEASPAEMTCGEARKSVRADADGYVRKAAPCLKPETLLHGYGLEWLPSLPGNPSFI